MDISKLTCSRAKGMDLVPARCQSIKKSAELYRGQNLGLWCIRHRHRLTFALDVQGNRWATVDNTCKLAMSNHVQHNHAHAAHIVVAEPCPCATTPGLCQHSPCNYAGHCRIIDDASSEGAAGKAEEMQRHAHQRQQSRRLRNILMRDTTPST